MTEDCDYLSISGVIRRQVRWLGHVARMANNSNPKTALLGGEGGKGKRGKPKNNWLQEVKEDLRQLSIADWSATAKNSELWEEGDA